MTAKFKLCTAQANIGLETGLQITTGYFRKGLFYILHLWYCLVTP